MVFKLSTHEGVPVNLSIPRGLVGGAISVIATLFIGLASLLVSNQRQLADHEIRIDYIEATRFTAEDARRLDSDFVDREDLQLLRNRLDRIETKLDRLLESR